MFNNIYYFYYIILNKYNSILLQTKLFFIHYQKDLCFVFILKIRLDFVLYKI